MSKSKRTLIMIVLGYVLSLLVVDVLLINIYGPVYGIKEVLPTERRDIVIEDPNITFSPSDYYGLSRDGRYLAYYHDTFYYLYSLSDTERPLWVIDIHELEMERSGKYCLTFTFLDDETFIYVLSSKPVNLSHVRDAEVWVISRTEGTKEKIFDWNATPPSEDYDFTVGLWRGYDSKRVFFEAYYEWWNPEEMKTDSKIFDIFELDVRYGVVKSVRIELEGDLADKASLRDINTQGSQALFLTDTEIYTASLSTGEIRCIHRMDKGTNTDLNGLYEVNYFDASYGPDGETILLSVWKGMTGQYGGDSYSYFILEKGKQPYPIYLHGEDESVRTFISEEGDKVYFLKDDGFLIVNIDREKAERFVMLIHIIEAVIFVGVAVPLGYLLWQVLKRGDCLKTVNLHCYIMVLLFVLLLLLIMANYVLGGTSRVGGVLLITVPFVWAYLRYRYNTGIESTALFAVLFLLHSFILVISLRASALGCLGGI